MVCTSAPETARNLGIDIDLPVNARHRAGVFQTEQARSVTKFRAHLLDRSFQTSEILPRQAQMNGLGPCRPTGLDQRFGIDAGNVGQPFLHPLDNSRAGHFWVIGPCLPMGQFELNLSYRIIRGTRPAGIGVQPTIPGKGKDGFHTLGVDRNLFGLAAPRRPFRPATGCHARGYR